ncbi:phosphoribosylaminoimidazole carboxylase [Shewanella putrefaciens]|nr:phosphoribosylaminoimidazole carboxylase [Shewanella putrefaciens]
MTQTNIKPKVWVLGNGQLGAMLTHAGEPLAIDVHAVDIMAPTDEILPLSPTISLRLSVNSGQNLP